ncbi:hypothetical protein HWC35_gp015 [Vibrio phage USC-1]|uniref:Uncharacterized protein n=2 Tax=Aphroditevirus USC1 TaxID=2846605 RepID=A0A514A2C1_9CAUD|nr:hypothetical protein HWC35_gp015 [Vibrio phage USC-1]QCW23107.1 hypothetical protein [Vibrio phage 5 TSL-2019]QDH47409.1 hypothetical protein [Vibrio phage USC-1]
MLKSQLEFFKKTIEEANQDGKPAPVAKYFHVLDTEVFITGTRISESGIDEAPELEMEKLNPVEQTLLTGIREVYEGRYADVTKMLPEDTPFERAWVIEDHLYGFTFKKIQ